MSKISKPNYKKIYYDLISMRFPNKMESCTQILSKNELSILDIIILNDIIFPNKDNSQQNSKHKAYNKETIEYILDYQLKHRLNNSQLATRFKLSRNTITKWKKIVNDGNTF